MPIVGTSPEAIHLAEEREPSGGCLRKPASSAPRHGMATSFDEAKAIADEIGFPVLVRPSYVLGGRGMEIVYDDDMLARLHRARNAGRAPEHPVLVDRFLDDAVEIDVDALFDGEELFLAGVMEHIEEAGIHSGDSACALPPMTLGRADIDRIRERHRSHRRRCGRSRFAQRAVRAGVRRACTCSRPTREPRARCRSSPRPRRPQSRRQPPA